ncbi:hypothetical protein MMUR_63490 [Mycolicibacterium murale]|uniref:Uncharacterized protein n=1 Tax=Mycolicibacterium murale TaxID=182220 RepID=A0A7I9WWW2_9MYCO|nr:hypothetical protein MMUR_63490 [Mycolicibacterium murale]
MNATSTVKGMATSNVGTRDTRAIIQVWSRNSRNWNGRWKHARKVSKLISTNPPTARAGTARREINVGPLLVGTGFGFRTLTGLAKAHGANRPTRTCAGHTGFLHVDPCEPDHSN